MSIRRGAALLFFALLIAFLAFRTQGYPPLFQYVLAPPAPAARPVPCSSRLPS